MAKHIDTEILAILRKFELAGELTAKKAIKDIREYPDRQLSRLLSFHYERQRFFIMFGNNTGDDEHFVIENIQLDEPGLRGTLVRNPLDENRAYGMPYKGKEVYLFQVESLKRRLDLELAERYPTYSRSTLQKYIKSGYVTVNGVVATQAKHATATLDEISVTPPEQTDYATSDLPIIYLDDEVIVVNKPAGVLTHSKGVMNDEFTVAEFFRRYTSFGLETNRPGIVHRLDRDTSGVIIGARTEAAALLLKKQFADRTTKKTYQAILDGVPKQTAAMIDLPIGRNPSVPSAFRVSAGGKAALTAYEVRGVQNGLSLVRMQPKTGRTHQLRVHMAYLNTPIHGDRIYGSKKADRLYLHAESLEITVPQSRRMTFQAPLPPEFYQLVTPESE